MDENEIMMNEVENSEEIENEGGIGTGLAMLIGSGLTIAAIAGGKKLKKFWDNYKAKKAENSSDSDSDEVVEVITLDDSK